MNIWEGVYPHFDDVPIRGDGFRSRQWIEQSLARAEKLLEESRTHQGGRGWVAYRESLLPVVAAMVSAERGRVSILDFGGGLGFTFLPVVAGLADSDSLDYHIVEVPELCEIGESLFNADHRVHFHPSLESSPQADIVHIGSALQYVRDWQQLLRELVARGPLYCVMTDLSAGEIQTFATSQRYYESRIPYWFFNINEVIDIMTASGYRLIFRAGHIATICGTEQDFPQDNLPEELRLGRACTLVFGLQRGRPGQAAHTAQEP